MASQIRFAVFSILILQVVLLNGQTHEELKALKENIQTLDSRLSRFRVTVTEVGKREFNNQLIDITTEFSFVADGKKLYCEGTVKGMPLGTQKFQVGFDGEINTRMVGSEKGWHFGSIDDGLQHVDFRNPLEYVCRMGDRPISEILDLQAPELLDLQERQIEIKDELVSITVLTEREGNTYKTLIVLDRNRGCSLRSMGYFLKLAGDSNWDCFHNIECESFAEIEKGLFVPTKCKYQTWRGPENETEKGMQFTNDSEITLTNWAIPPADEPTSFQVQFPKGLLVQDRRVGQETKPFTPSLDEEIATRFGVNEKPTDRLTKACKQATLNRQLVLVYFADPIAPTTREFMQIRLHDEEVLRSLDGFRIMAVSIAGSSAEPAKDLADKLGMLLPSDDAIGSLSVVDTNGKFIATKPCDDFVRDGKINRELILDFLAEHSLKPFDAQALLNEALERAKKENKRVFIQETATWCSPCWRLSEFLDRTRDIWEQDYLWVKMDYRWTGAKDIMLKIRNGAEGGIPWVAILDSEGNVLITSNGADGKNIGFPTTDTDKSHFHKMIMTTKIRLTEEQVSQLEKALDGKRP